MKFKKNDLVKSRNTFFSGFFGKVQSFETMPDGDIEYWVKGNYTKDEKYSELKFKESELKKVFFGRWW